MGGTTVSFVDSEQKTDDTLQLKFDLVLYIIRTKQEENKVAAAARANSEKRQQIMGLIAQKEFDTVAGQSVDELKALLGTLT